MSTKIDSSKKGSKNIDKRGEGRTVNTIIFYFGVLTVDCSLRSVIPCKNNPTGLGIAHSRSLPVLRRNDTTNTTTVIFVCYPTSFAAGD